MKINLLFLVVALVSAALLASSVHAADRAVADSLAMAGTAMAAKGNTAAARDSFYKALANDEACPDAIFELAKLFDKENNTAAASDFYQRASMLMAQENKPGMAAKRAEAEKRLKALNPFAPRMSGLMEDYAQDLDKLVKKVPDTVTQDAAVARVGDLKLAAILPPEKMPKFYAAHQAAKTAAVTPPSEVDVKKPPKRSMFGEDDTAPAKVVTKVSPEVERELKALGWATVTGTWTKKSAGVFECTDGKLEAAKTNGGIDLWIQKSSGTVKASVRSDFKSGDSFFGSDFPGYGVQIKSKDCRVYAPAGYTGMIINGSKSDPSHAKTEPLPDANPKNHALITIADGLLEISVNEKKTLRYKDDKLPKSGSFVIEIKGTVTLENPRCAGN